MYTGRNVSHLFNLVTPNVAIHPTTTTTPGNNNNLLTLVCVQLYHWVVY